MPINSERSTQPLYSLAGTVLLSLMALSACAYRYGIYMMLPDNFNYITYWQQLFEGSFRATSLQTPKPLLVLIFGALWKLTGSPVFLIVLFIGIGTLAVCASARIVNRICGPAYGWLVLALLLPNAAFLRAVLSGYSELLSAAGIVWLIARHLEKDRIKPPDLWTAICLITLNFIRPENWLFSAAVAIIAVVAAIVTPSRTCAPVKALWQARQTLLMVCAPLLAPLAWFAFDYFAFGDPLFSLKVPAHFAGAGSPAQSHHWWAYVLEVATSIRNQISLIALGLAVIGVAVVCKRRPSLLILLGLPLITTVAFYVIACVTISGLELYDRFIFVPVLMILVVSCIGLAWATKWLLRGDAPFVRLPIEKSPLVIGKGILAVVAIILLLVVEHRSLPSKISGFDTFARWRISGLSAAEAIRRDTDYGPSMPVIVRVEDLALVGWALRSNGQNFVDTMNYVHEGARLSSDIPIAYFIINQPHWGKLFPELPNDKVPGFRTTAIYDDSTTVVYKVRRASEESHR